MQDIVLYQKSTYKFIIVSGGKQTILKEKKKLGGQNKVPRLANNREYIDHLLELNKA